MTRPPFAYRLQILYVPRSRLHNTPLDIKGDGKSVTVVVWAIRESGNHALAGIWHEGTDLKHAATTSKLKVERGQRQYALFAGLNKAGSACGHVSENGGSSFRNKYALHKCNSVGISSVVSADSPAYVLDASWECFAMTFNDETDELTGWLNGVAGDRWLDNPKKDGLISSAYNAYMKGHYNRAPGLQRGEDESFPKDQYYNPPEDELIVSKILREGDRERIERREYKFTKIEVKLAKSSDGQWEEIERELVALRLNPWWYPHGIYSPQDRTTGGPFTIGRVIHSSLPRDNAFYLGAESWPVWDDVYCEGEIAFYVPGVHIGGYSLPSPGRQAYLVRWAELHGRFINLPLTPIDDPWSVSGMCQRL